jgi:hypothetical protein
MAIGTPNEPNLERLLMQGIAAAKQNNKQAARMIFDQVLSQDKRNERAWLWLAAIEDDLKERRRILLTVLTLNPHNTTAKTMLEKMDRAVERAEAHSMRIGITLILIVIALIGVVMVVALILVNR